MTYSLLYQCSFWCLFVLNKYIFSFLSYSLGSQGDVILQKSPGAPFLLTPHHNIGTAREARSAGSNWGTGYDAQIPDIRHSIKLLYSVLFTGLKRIIIWRILAFRTKINMIYLLFSKVQRRRSHSSMTA